MELKEIMKNKAFLNATKQMLSVLNSRWLDLEFKSYHNEIMLRIIKKEKV